MERSCRLTNTTYWDITPFLSLPSLPVSSGSLELGLRLSEESNVGGPDVISQAGTIAEFLGQCDVSYLDLKEPPGDRDCLEEPSWLCSEVLKCNSEAFEYCNPGLAAEKNHNNSLPKKEPFDQNSVNQQAPQYSGLHFGDQTERVDHVHAIHSFVGSKKPKQKKKEHDPIILTTESNKYEHQDIVGSFKNLVDEVCGRVESTVDNEEMEERASLSLSDIRRLTNEIFSMRTRKILQLVPVGSLIRILAALDHQILFVQGLSIGDNNDADVLVICALESIYASLAIMTHQDMPKQLYKEEIIDRIIDFTRHQVMDVMAACDPCYRAIHRPNENSRFEGSDDDEDADGIGSTVKKRISRNAKEKKTTRSGHKASTTVNSVVQKLCSIIGFLKDLLTIEKLSDSCILQLAKTSFSTFLAENIQLIQLKAIGLICAVYASYAHHRNFLVDETVHLIWKLPFSKRAPRSYHLPDEESKQIQMITALLIQLVQSSANYPEIHGSKLTCNSFQNTSVDVTYLSKCQKSATETCCQFWTSVIERFTTAKPQDVSESKMIIENLVVDLLTTLNLPEFPASAPLLEVLCVLLLENTGLKSKDMTARCATIDLLGTIAARLKRDSVSCKINKFWIAESILGDKDNTHCTTDKCCACLREINSNTSIICPACQRCFHAECVGVSDVFRDWSCHVCTCKKQLMVLHSYCKSQQIISKKNLVAAGSTSGDSTFISSFEIVQQILLNYLQESSLDDDIHVSTRWFYLCLWCKDDPLAQDKTLHYAARLKSKSILREFGATSWLPREWVKKICLALAQNNSFSRGFDNILSLLLASLRENSPVLRAKALRAVSSIVEADPEVLCDKRVQCAVEGRFCDSAISVREAALELVGRHIASHPDVGLKYFEKVAERIKDTGVSVRKRAIKIIRDMCMSNANFSDITSAFIEIISRVGDDESSIQELVCKTFYEFWFEVPSSGNTQFVSDASSVPLEVAKKAEQIVDLFRKMPSHQLILLVIKRNLALDFLPQSAKAAPFSALSLASVRKRCQLMCKHLLERILQIDEANESDDVHALPYILAIQAFCIVDPTLCIPATDPSQFVATLEPHLKNQIDNRSVAQLLESIIFIIDAVLPLLRKPPQSVLDDLEQDLKHMIVRHSYLTVVHACIKCLCSLSKITQKGSSLVGYLIRVFLKQLQGSPVENKQLLGRSLFCLGLLVRYGDNLIHSSCNQNGYIEKSLQLLKTYVLLEDFGLKARSLQALGHILIARPDYMLKNDIKNILWEALSTGADARLKMQALQNIFEYLFDVENQMATESNINRSEHTQDVGSKVPVAAGAGDTNICGGIIQLYWENILGNCMDINDQVRQNALKIVEIVLRQGLVHPITCVPHLVALETDPLEVNAKLAHHLLMNMNEKYPSFFESRLGDGLLMSFRFFQSIFNTRNVTGVEKGKPTGSAFSCVRPGISRIYRLIRTNRMSRNKFIHSIIRKFEPGCWTLSSIPFLVYCAEILASLPFTCPDEPLYLIYDINRILQVRTGPVESNLKMWCSENLVGEITEKLENHDEAEEVYNDTIVQQVSVCIESENIQKLQMDCHDAIALQLLLKLKRYLKITYNLNDARCQAFSLKDHPKPGEILSKQSIPFNINDTSLVLPSSYKDVVNKYQELKQLLKDDTLDFSTYTSSVKRKRPTPKSSRKKVTSRREQDDDDDDGGADDDDDWTGGPRKLNFSAPKADNGRLTR